MVMGGICNNEKKLITSAQPAFARRNKSFPIFPGNLLNGAQSPLKTFVFVSSRLFSRPARICLVQRRRRGSCQLGMLPVERAVTCLALSPLIIS